MAMVQPKQLKYRKAAAHAFLLVFLCFIIFPLLLIVAISFRAGNYSVGSVIPTASTFSLDHWKLALGIPITQRSRELASHLEFTKDASGNYQVIAYNNGQGDFVPFISDNFTEDDVKRAGSESPLHLKISALTTEPPTESLISENECKAMMSALSKKSEFSFEDESNPVRYVIEPINQAGTINALYRKTETPPPFPVLRWLWNSIKVAFITATLIICLSTTSAYAFARMRFKGKRTLLNGMLIFQMFPSVLALVAIYALFDKIGDYVPWLGLNTHGGLILSYMGGIALHIWTIKGYFETIDPSLEQAAAIDGATPWQAFRLILLPLSVPILAVVFILAFIGTITEVPVASVLLMDMDALTLAVGSQQYLYPQNYLWGDFAAAAVLSGLPITIVFLLAQRWLVGGLTAGGVKG